MTVTRTNYQAQAMKYYDLISKGTPSDQAFSEAFPTGLPNAQQQAEDSAASQQKSGAGALGGLLAGALGTKVAYDAATGKPILGGLFSSGGGAATSGIGPVASGADYASALGAPGEVATNAVSGAVPGASYLSAAAPYLGAAGAIGGGIGLYNNLTNKPSIGGGALSGAALGGGLAAASPLLLGAGPVGWGALALGTALGAGGGGLLGALGKRWNPDHWKDEQNAVQGLANDGVTGWDQFAASMPQLTGGRSDQQLIAEQEALKAAGKPSNIEFAKTRDEKYLTPDDITGYSVFGKKYGNDWFGTFDVNKRNAIAQTYLDANAVDEAKGGITLNSNPELDAQIQAIINAQNPQYKKLPGQVGNGLAGALR